MSQGGTDEPATAPVQPMAQTAATEPAIEPTAAACPIAACSGDAGGAADSASGLKRGGENHAQAPASAATTAAIPNDVAAAAAAAVAATAATASCAAAAAAAAATVGAAAAVTAGAGKHDNASVAVAARGALEGEAAAVPVLEEAATVAAVGPTSTSSGSSSIGGDSTAGGVTRAEGKGDTARVGKQPRSLSAWLKEGPFVLAMSPGFFGFYAHIGALIALEAEGLLQAVSFATGASAGGLVAGLFAAGLSPADMGETVVKFRRSDFWDPVGFGGLLRGKKFEEILKATLPPGVSRFDQCRVPLAVSAFDALRLKTKALGEGCLAQALRATCTFPVLFAPVWRDRGVLVDGGVRDTTGMWCVPAGRESCRRVLNVTFGDKDDRGACVPPSSGAVREAGMVTPATPVAAAAAVPMRSAATVAVPATGPTMIPSDYTHQHNAPSAAAASVEASGAKKRRRAGGVECLRSFNHRGLAEDDPDEELRGVKRDPGVEREGAPRTSKRARQPKVPWTG
eukprot:g13973.t1